MPFLFRGYIAQLDDEPPGHLPFYAGPPARDRILPATILPNCHWRFSLGTFECSNGIFHGNDGFSYSRRGLRGPYLDDGNEYDWQAARDGRRISSNARRTSSRYEGGCGNNVWFAG